MTPKQFPLQVTAELRTVVNEACTDTDIDLPYAAIAIVGNGRNNTTELFNYSAGQGIGKNGNDDILWLASCTKLVTSIACMQLVEQGTLSLDDPDQVEAICQELKDIKVVQEDGTLTEKTRRITLRMLLTHTAGFGYSFLNPALKKYRARQPEYDEFSGRAADFLQPLVNQPGERFEYGISMDWAGIVVERVTGLKLNTYMHQRIFDPLGIRELSMFPSPDTKSRVVGIWQRNEEGRLSRRQYPLQRPLDELSDEDTFHSGGAGLFGSVREFTKILIALLNDGTSPATGRQILLPATVQEMFTNQLAHQPNFARHNLHAVKEDLVYPATELYPLCPAGKPQGWGLSFMISPGVTGRPDTTAHWSGLSSIFWWCDREKGVAGIVGSQVLPFADQKAAMLWAQIEGKVYGALQDL